MAATDARPIPLKNTAYRVYFPILDSDGDLVTGATGLDTEISIDGGTPADATNEATEIGASGMYFLDLTAAEMNGDAIVIVVQTSTSPAKSTPIVLYPEEDGDIRARLTDAGVDAIHDELVSEHTIAGSVGERIGRLPNAAAGGAGGVPTVDANNRVAGIQGTLTTLDALDTAQDSQHAATQASLVTIDSIVDAILVDTGALADDALPDSIPADGAMPTLRQAVYMTVQYLLERAVVGTTLTVRKPNGTDTLMTVTLDSAVTPTSVTRAT